MRTPTRRPRLRSGNGSVGAGEGQQAGSSAIELRCLVDDSNDLNPWLYTAMLTGRGGELGDARAFAVEHFNWLVSDNPDDLNPQKINSENARVRQWMDRHPNGARYCFELDAIHEDLDWFDV